MHSVTVCKLTFIWGQNEDRSLGESTSDGSERLLQRGGDGKVEIYVILVRGELMQESMYFSLFFFGRGF